MTLTSSIRAQINATLAGSGEAIGNPQVSLNLQALANLADGTSNVQADKVYAKTATIAASGTAVLDMGSGGGMLDPLGVAFEPAEVVAVLITADAGNTNDVVVGANGAEPFVGPMAGTTPTTSIKPGGCLLWFVPAGWAVTNNSNDKLKIANSSSGSGVTYSIVMLARSA